MKPSLKIKECIFFYIFLECIYQGLEVLSIRHENIGESV